MAINLDKLVIAIDYFDEEIKYPYIFDKIYNCIDFIINELGNNNILSSNIKVVNQDAFTVVSMEIVNNNDYTINLGDFLVNVYKDDTLVLDLKPHVDKDIRAKNAKEIKVTIKELHSEVNSLEIQLPNLKIIEETDS